MTIDVYVNYGCLAAEKVNIYTYSNPHPSAVCFDVVTVEIPSEFDARYNSYGSLILRHPDFSYDYKVDELLDGDRHQIQPYFCFYCESGYLKKYRLQVLKLNGEEIKK